MAITHDSAASVPPADPRVLLGPARWGDIREIREAYLAQPDEARRLYHPLPFNLVRLTLTLDLLVLFQRLSLGWARRLPRAAVMLYAARDGRDGRLAGFGTLRFRRCSDGVLAAETGYFILPEFRRRGIGRRLKWAMIELGRRKGARRAQALILPNNVPSLRLNAGLGFHVRPSSIRDRHPPYEEFLMSELELGDAPIPHEASVDPTRAAEPA